MIISRKRYVTELDEAEHRGMGKAYRDMEEQRDRADFAKRLVVAEEAVARYHELERRLDKMELELCRLRTRCDVNANTLRTVNAEYRARVVNALERMQKDSEDDKEADA